MTIDQFTASLSETSPPSGLSPLLKALWFDKKGDWTSSHNIAQDVHTPEGSWVHAYLHRKEGDAGNAAYWYSRAAKPVSKQTLDEEWADLVASLLK
jgi:hypothetical protein